MVSGRGGLRGGGVKKKKGGGGGGLWGGGGGGGVLGRPCPPFVSLFLSKQPTTGGENDMAICWILSLWQSVTPSPYPFEKSWLRPWANNAIHLLKRTQAFSCTLTRYFLINIFYLCTEDQRQRFFVVSGWPSIYICRNHVFPQTRFMLLPWGQSFD